MQVLANEGVRTIRQLGVGSCPKLFSEIPKFRNPKPRKEGPRLVQDKPPISLSIERVTQRVHTY